MRRRPLPDPDDAAGMINMTPLLDVLFVVLILFILAAPLLQVDHVALSPGSPAYADFASNSSSLNIRVDHKGEITIQSKPINAALLSKTLAALHTKFPTLKPVVYHDKQATFGTYQTLKNALEEAGFHEMDIILQSS